MSTQRTPHEWYRIVAFGRPTPAVPRTAYPSLAAAYAALQRWTDRIPHDDNNADRQIDAHRIRIHAYRTREAARGGSLGDANHDQQSPDLTGVYGPYSDANAD